MPEEDNLLDPVEVRVVGALAEKAMTTPDYYPLTINALTLACNQTSNREPVVAFDEQTVVRALDRLRERKLAFLYGGAQSRVPRYGHKLDEVFELGRAELAALCVLLLRGPQTVGEIKGRTGRMHGFETLPDVESILERLATRPERPLVAKLPRQIGFKEQRYAQLLGASAEAGPEPATTEVRLENERAARLEEQIEELRGELAELKAQFADFRKQFE